MNYILYIICCWIGLQSSLYAANRPDATIMCSACHGSTGISTNPAWPHLASQHALYLIKQLHDLKKGTTRTSPLMTPLLANLSDEDIINIAHYYAAQKHNITQEHNQKNKRGETLYRHGDSAHHIPSCMTCHGPDGAGNEQAGFPVIAGQQATYTVEQLQAFKQHQRHNDLNNIMRDISERLTEEDMQAVADYFQTLGSHPK